MGLLSLDGDFIGTFSGMLIVTSQLALPQTEKCSGGLTVEYQLIS